MSSIPELFTKDPELQKMRSEIETDLQATIARSFPDLYQPLQRMLEYHMGWLDDRSVGKRIRPFLTLLISAASGGNWYFALPAATAIELVHNFSLIHDDIQDQSEKRHNRPTLWKEEGIAQAINAGDSMYTIAFRKIWDLEENYPLELVRRIYLILNHTCLRLTQGQFLDLSFEDRASITDNDYLEMIGGKTNALISTCCQVGALLGNQDPQAEIHFTSYGHNIGMAFQIMDDYLGIWGDEESTGKSTANDLVTGKKSYPITIGLASANPFRDLWESGSINNDNALHAANLLENTGAKDKTTDLINKYSQNALTELALACGDTNRYYPHLVDLTNWLLNRKS